MAADDDLAETGRTGLRRHPERGRYARGSANAALDAGLVAHVGFVVDGAPRVLPMAYGRVEDRLYVHGAVGNAMLCAAEGVEVCVTVTVLDGLVFARSAFHHSMNYRSVVLLGTATKVTDEAEKRAALDAIVDHAVSGRSAVARPPTAGELTRTTVLRLPIGEGSVKVRTGDPVEEAADLDLPVWAGVIPVAQAVGVPVQAAGQDRSDLVAPAIALPALPDGPGRAGI